VNSLSIAKIEPASGSIISPTHDVFEITYNQKVKRLLLFLKFFPKYAMENVSTALLTFFL